ncbi:MAG: hypothetical protein RJA70_53 [Pseudomonadota bacterium]|jgi:ATP-dependent Clp protease ATP-binding subunit ClpB
MSNGTTTLSLDNYAGEAKAWVAAAQQLADEKRHVEVDPLHLLSCGLELDPGIAAVFQKAGVDLRDVIADSQRALGRLPRGDGQAFLSESMLELMRRAERDVRAQGPRKVELEDLLNALTQEVRGAVADILGGVKLGPGGLRGYMDALRSVPRPAAAASQSANTADLVKDLVEAARSGLADPVIGRQQEIRRVLTILERRHKGHPILVGEPGVGKGAIIRGLALKIANGDVPTSLAELKLLEIDAGALTSGTRLRGEAEARMRKLIDSQLTASRPGAIFVVRSLTRLLGTSATAPALGDLFTSAFAGGKLRLLATVSPEGWRTIEANEPALARKLTPLVIEAPSFEEATEIVRGVAGQYEKHHRVLVTEGAVQASVTLARRYLSDRFLPDSALDLLDETAASRRVGTDGISPEVDAQRSQLSSLLAQQESLADSTDALSLSKVAELSARIAELQPQVEKQRAAIESRRGAVGALRQLSQEHADAERAREAAKTEKNYARLGELEHVTIPALKTRLEQAEKAVAQAGLVTERAAIDESHIAQTLAEWTQIPVAKMLEEEADKLLKMEERLGQRVIGQPDAVTAIAKAIRRGRVGLRDPRRPIGSFLFLGTSGVGKTELAKALAEFLFDDEQALTRLDMSEFMERHMAQRLLGAPPGYADSDKGGFLTEAVRKRPYSVLLFDEVEKAHQDVFNLLLQVLDDGRLTDGRGRLADFTNTVVILTSNIGSERLIDTPAEVFESEDGKAALQDVLMQRLQEFFRPEFLNRIGDTVVFRPLSKKDLRSIVDIQLRGLEKLLARRQISLKVDDAAKDRLVDLGYDPALGARPLQRVIVRHLQDPLAEELLKGGYKEGQTIHVALDGEVFRFRAD